MRKVAIISQFAVRSSQFAVRRILSFIRNLYRKIFTYPIKLYNRFRLKNKHLTIISKDCVGGMLLHNLGLRFDTPTINLWFTSADFVRFCSDMKYYFAQELREDSSSDMDYPVGLLGSEDRQITIYFLHYDNFQQAKEKWYERASRIHWDNMFFIMTDREGCTASVIHDFEALPYKHKALLTYRDLPNTKSAVKLSTHGLVSRDAEPVNVLNYLSAYSLRRIIDDWDYVSFLNS